MLSLRFLVSETANKQALDVPKAVRDAVIAKRLSIITDSQGEYLATTRKGVTLRAVPYSQLGKIVEHVHAVESNHLAMRSTHQKVRATRIVLQ